MANGFFLGGAAEGIQAGRAGMRANEALDLEREGLGLREKALTQEASQFDRKLGLEERGLGLREKQMKFEQGRAVQAEVDAAIASTMKLAADTITAGLEADRDPEVLRKAVTPLLADAQALAKRINRNPATLAKQLDTMLTLPGAEEAAAAEGKAAAAKQKAMTEGGVSLLKPEQKVTVENSLRDDFIKQATPFIETRDAYQRIQSIESDNKTGAGDVALVYSYMKMLDPRSTVREGEIAMARDAAGVPGTVLNLYNSVIKGETLTPDVRNAFRAQAKALFSKQASQHERRAKTFEEIAKRQGADPRNVVIDLSQPEEAKTPAGGAGGLPPLPEGFVEVK